MCHHPQPGGAVSQAAKHLIVSDGDRVPYQPGGGLQHGVQVGDSLSQLRLTAERPEAEGEPVVHLSLLQDSATIQGLGQAGQAPETQRLLQDTTKS